MTERPIRLSFCAIHKDSWPATRSFLESLWPQIPEDAELVLVDGGSRDASRAYLDAFARDHASRFTLIVDPGDTRGRARDRAWRAARGSVIVQVDGDRSWAPDGVLTLEALVAANGDTPFSVTSATASGGPAVTYVMPRRVLAAVGGYDTSLTYYEDQDVRERVCRAHAWNRVNAELFADNWKGKMRRPTYLVRYYWQMGRDGARVRTSLRGLVSHGLKRPLSWPFVAVSVLAYAVGRLRAPARCFIREAVPPASEPPALAAPMPPEFPGAALPDAALPDAPRRRER